MPKIHSQAAVQIGVRMRTARQAFGISLEDLGELANINWTTIGKIERGASSPTAETLVRIASALEIDPATFITGITSELYGPSTHQVTARDLIDERARKATEEQ